MPRVRKHATDADRQAAYRQRRSSQRSAMVIAGLPALPKPTALPGTARWRQGIAEAQRLLEVVQQEMQEYYDQRSETWQEGEKGDAFQERLDAIADVAAQIGDLP